MSTRRATDAATSTVHDTGVDRGAELRAAVDAAGPPAVLPDMPLTVPGSLVYAARAAGGTSRARSLGPTKRNAGHKVRETEPTDPGSPYGGGVVASGERA